MPCPHPLLYSSAPCLPPSPQVYKNTKATLQKLLGVGSKATARDLCIQFGCARHESAVKAALTAYKERFVRRLPAAKQGHVDFGRPVFLAAAFYLVARKNKTQVGGAGEGLSEERKGRGGGREGEGEKRPAGWVCSMQQGWAGRIAASRAWLYLATSLECFLLGEQLPYRDAWLSGWQAGMRVDLPYLGLPCLQVDKSKLLQPLGVTSKEFAEVLVSMNDLIPDLVGTAADKKRSGSGSSRAQQGGGANRELLDATG